MLENPFSDSVPTPLAIAATVYTKPLVQLRNETKTKKSRLIVAIGGYGNGKSHALERLKNDINIKETKKLAIYCSAYATKSLKETYNQVSSELLSGKISKLDSSPENKILMESKGIPEKVVNLFYKGNRFKGIEGMRKDMPFGKVINSSADVVNFISALSLLVDQFVLLMDDIEEATTLEKAERKAFFGYIRALYDQAVRSDLSVIIVMTFTPQKLELLREDREDLYERVDSKIELIKPTLKEVTEIIDKRLKVSGLDEYKIDKGVIKKIYNNSDSIRGIFNILRDLLEKAEEKNSKKIDKVELSQKTRPFVEEHREGYKPADDNILTILEENPGLQAEDIVKKTGMSDPWIRHRLADMMKTGILRKEQAARNRPAKYYVAGKAKKSGEK